MWRKIFSDIDNENSYIRSPTCLEQRLSFFIVIMLSNFLQINLRYAYVVNQPSSGRVYGVEVVNELGQVKYWTVLFGINAQLTID